MRSTKAVLLLGALALAAPRPAAANPISLILKAAKVAGKAADGVSTAGKAAGAAGKASGGAKLVGAAKVAGGAGALAWAERAGLLFTRIPDEAGRVPVFVARQGDELAAVGRAGPLDDGVTFGDALADDWFASVGRGDAVDIYLDPTAALDAPVDDLSRGRVYVVDAQGEPHALRRTEADDGWELLDGQDLVEFVLDQLGSDEEDVPATEEVAAAPTPAPASAALEASAEAPDRDLASKGYWLLLIGLIVLGIREYRKPTVRTP